MAAASEISPDATRRRRRHRTIAALALASVLLGSAFVVESFLNDNVEVTAWTADTVFPKWAKWEHIPSSRDGVTVPIGKRVVHAVQGQGGPEDPGPYIEEARDGWLLEDGQAPFGGFARSGFTPDHVPVPGNGFSFARGGGGSGGGGGDGGIVLACPKDTAAIEKLTGKECAAKGTEAAPTDADETPDSGGLMMLPGVVSSVPGGTPPLYPDPTQGTGNPGLAPSDDGVPSVSPVSVVPEPQNWAMMIAGFFMMGSVIRSSRRKARQMVAFVR